MGSRKHGVPALCGSDYYATLLHKPSETSKKGPPYCINPAGRSEGLEWLESNQSFEENYNSQAEN